MAELGAAARVPPAAAAAVVLPVAAAAAAAGAAPAAAARPASMNWQRLRLKWGKALLLLACAATALAPFATSTADSRRVLGPCSPADAEAAALRAASEHLLLAAAAQGLGATTAMLVPARPVALFATLLGWQTGYCAPRVLRMLVACHGSVDVMLAIYYWIFVVAMWVAYVVGALISIAG